MTSFFSFCLPLIYNYANTIYPSISSSNFTFSTHLKKDKNIGNLGEKKC